MFLSVNGTAESYGAAQDVPSLSPNFRLRSLGDRDAGDRRQRLVVEVATEPGAGNTNACEGDGTAARAFSAPVSRSRTTMWSRLSASDAARTRRTGPARRTRSVVRAGRGDGAVPRRLRQSCATSSRVSG